MVKTTRSIINKWLSQFERPSGFIRFLNGIKTDCHGANLEFVSLRDAMMYLEEWTVDWDMQLTSKEIDLVKDPIVETSAHMAISDLIRIGNEEYGQEYLNDSDEEGNFVHSSGIYLSRRVEPP